MCLRKISKDANNIHWRKKNSISTTDVRKTDSHMQRILCFHSAHNSKWIKDNVRPETLKLLGKNRHMLQFISIGKDFLNEISSSVGNKTNNQYTKFNEIKALEQ